MPAFLMAQLMTGTALMTLASLHFAIGSRTAARTDHMLLAITGLFAAAEAFCAFWQLTARPEFAIATELSSIFHVLLGSALVWFLVCYINPRPTWIPKVVTACGAVVIFLHLSLPVHLRSRGMPDSRDLYPLRAYRIVRPGGVIGPGSLAASVFDSFVLACIIWACVYLWRRKAKRKAVWVTLGTAPLALVAYPHGFMIDWGILPPPVLYSFASLPFVAFMSLNLIRESVQPGKVTGNEEPKEYPWQSLLENVNLLVASCDRSGRLDYINSSLLRVSGFAKSELLGQPFSSILQMAGEHQVSELLERAFTGEISAATEGDLVTKGGAKRTVIWSHLALRQSGDNSPRTLSVGVDVTERVRAETERDQALRDLQKLKSRLEAENVYLKEEAETTVGSPHIIGHSGSIRYVLQKIQQVSETEASVLIEGETGVGKELVARAIHEESRRSKGPFIRVNCAALPPTLVESELFGHEKGAFTGADRLRKGRFELAEGGTLFLHEVGELSLEIQAKLLRVLQEAEFERVGGSRTLKADVRVVAATTRNLRLDVSSGRFREDLYYRLQVFPISVPPLRDRREDIPLLVQHFARQMALKHGKVISEVPAEVVAVLMEWDWPGNVRELANILERAIITCKGERLALPPELRPVHPTSPETEGRTLVSLAKMERQYILRVLERTNWKIGGKGGAAEILELHPNTLRTRMEKLGITTRKSETKFRGGPELPGSS